MGELKPGDIAKFVCQDGAFGMVKTLKVDTADDLPVPEPVYHFLIYSLRTALPPTAAHLPEAKPFIAHLPVFSSGAAKSNCEIIGFETVLEEELEGYELWQEAFLNGEAGVFNLPLDEAIA
ncbi:MAG: hypothetical protein HGB11_03035, partial [Chlorobiales bacterium]|nr:hypothetical protein [Chlorobiales bacterium]